MSDETGNLLALDLQNVTIENKSILYQKRTTKSKYYLSWRFQFSSGPRKKLFRLFTYQQSQGKK